MRFSKFVQFVSYLWPLFCPRSDFESFCPSFFSLVWLNQNSEHDGRGDTLDGHVVNASVLLADGLGRQMSLPCDPCIFSTSLTMKFLHSGLGITVPLIDLSHAIDENRVRSKFFRPVHQRLFRLLSVSTATVCSSQRQKGMIF